MSSLPTELEQSAEFEKPQPQLQDRKEGLTLFGEFSRLLTLSLPLMGAQVAQMMMGLVDTILAGRLSAEDLAGVALGGNVFWPVMILFSGVLMAVTPSVAQLYGRGKIADIGDVIHQSLWMVVAISVIVVPLLHQAGPLYGWLDSDPAAVVIALPYLEMMAWGVPGVMGYFALRYLADGMGNTRLGMVVAVAALGLKVPLSYGLVYGEFGLPRMGGVGCGLATAITMWFEFFAMLVLILVFRRYRATGVLRHFSRPDFRQMRKLASLGIPIGITIFVEIALFSLTSLLLSRFGAEVLAAHQIAIQFCSIIYMVPLAIGMGGTIRVGFYVGIRRLADARRVGFVALAGATAMGLLFLIAVLLWREQIAFFYLDTTESTVFHLAVQLLVIGGIFQLFDAPQAAALSLLRGFKDTRVPLIITLIGYWAVGLPVGISFGYGWLVPEYGVYGFWLGLVVGLFFVATFGVLRFNWLSRQEQRIYQLAKR